MEEIIIDNFIGDAPKTLLIITGVMIFTDIITGYLKAIKFVRYKLNS